MRFAIDLDHFFFRTDYKDPSTIHAICGIGLLFIHRLISVEVVIFTVLILHILN